MILSVGPDVRYAAEEIFNRKQEHPCMEGEGTASQRERRKVLVVDDQKLIADSLAEILGHEGFDAIAAYNGWDALEAISRFQPDWLVSDVLMPRMNGVQLAITVRQKYPLVAILLFSGQAGISEMLQDGQDRGYQFELIAKPIHPLKLIERLKSGREP